MGNPLGKADLVIVSRRGLDRKPKEFRADCTYLWGTRYQNVLERRGLKDAIVRSMNDQIQTGKSTPNRNPWTQSLLVKQELIVIPTESDACRPIMQSDQVLNESRLLKVGPSIRES